MTWEEQTKKFRKIVAKAWMDEDFKRRLLSNPGELLSAEGFEIPDGVEVRMTENTDKVFNLVLPAKPAEGDAEEIERRESASYYGWF